jgi:hypothetical protein
MPLLPNALLPASLPRPLPVLGSEVENPARQGRLEKACYLRKSGPPFCERPGLPAATYGAARRPSVADASGQGYGVVGGPIQADPALTPIVPRTVTRQLPLRALRRGKDRGFMLLPSDGPNDRPADARERLLGGRVPRASPRPKWMRGNRHHFRLYRRQDDAYFSTNTVAKPAQPKGQAGGP